MKLGVLLLFDEVVTSGITRQLVDPGILVLTRGRGGICGRHRRFTKRVTHVVLPVRGHHHAATVHHELSLFVR